MSAPQFLPWQLETARNWLGNRERFAHAWLVHGLAGIGKLDFAVAAAASLLCETPQDGLACGHCAACAWFASGNHPDLRRIRPEAIAVEEGAEAAEQAGTPSPWPAAHPSARRPEIRIDQIRALESWFNTATHRGGWRVALLYPAHALNVVSANALLKVLEEPPPHTVFLLVADAPDRLLPTLVSRCRRLPAGARCRHRAAMAARAGVEPAREWLAAGGNAPLAALRLAQSGEPPVPMAGPVGRAAGAGPVARCGHAGRGAGKGAGDRLDRRAATLLYRPDAGRRRLPVRYFPRWARACKWPRAPGRPAWPKPRAG